MSRFEAEFGQLVSNNPFEKASNELGRFAYLVGLGSGECFDEIKRLRNLRSPKTRLTEDGARRIWIAREKIKDIDKGTGLVNKNYFDLTLEQRIEELYRLPQEERYPLAVSLADINRMKRLNSRFGHNLTDDIIKLVANLMLSNYRSSDTVARRSGDENLALQPHGDFEVAMYSALRTQVTIKENIPQLKRYLGQQLGKKISTLDLSLSFGVTDFDPFNNDTAESVTTRADFAMYNAKRKVHDDRTIEAIGLSKSTGNDAVAMVFTYPKKDCRPEMIPELEQEISRFIKEHQRAWVRKQVVVANPETINSLAANYEKKQEQELFQIYDRINKQSNPPRSEYH